MDEQQKQIIWNDGLHLTPKGYEYMATFIYDEVLDFVVGLSV